MQYIEVTKEELEKMKLIYPTTGDYYKNVFSHLYFDGEKTVYKVLLGDHSLDDIKIKELIYLKNLSLTSTTNPLNILTIDGIPSAFTIEHFDGKNLDSIPKEYKKRLNILRSAKNNLLDIHRNHIIVGDLHSGNILFNENGETKFCDIDGMLITPGSMKRMNNLEREYFEVFHTIDQRCDIYLFNILTLAILLDRSSLCSGWVETIRFGNKELDKIISFLSSCCNIEYSEKFIIDYMPDTEKEFKRLTRKIR